LIDLFTSPDGKLRPVWRFVVSAIATYFVIFYTPSITYALGIPESFAWAVDRCLTALVLFGLYVFLLRVVDHSPSPVTDLGLSKDRASTDLIIGVLFGAGLVALAIGFIAVLGSYRAEVIATRSVTVPFLTVLTTLIAGALAEELAFRGYPFQRLVNAVGPPVAIFIFSALFGAIHFFNPSFSLLGFLNTILIGILFSIAYLMTRSLWVVWGMHFGWNFMLGVVAGLPVSGLNAFSLLLQGHATGPEWLTGGAYGIEGSLTATVVISLGTALMVPVIKLLSRTAPGTNGSIQAQ
jgi:membrane protease YdiL (CAAX protease family)